MSALSDALTCSDFLIREVRKIAEHASTEEMRARLQLREPYFGEVRAITAGRASLALDDLSQLLIDRHSHETLVGRIWELRDSLTACDAAYVALAEGLAAPLLTCDGRLARAHGHDARIELVGNG